MSKPEIRLTVRRSGRDDGMTIVELMVALTIVMIAFAALASTLMASFSSIRNTEARVRGVALANELVEEMATIPWEQLGLHEDDEDLEDAISAVPAGETLEFDDEAVVLLIEAADPIPSHRDDIDRDGRTYRVTRWVTWAEEDNRPELKRMVAIVEWDSGGREFTIRSDGLRAPDAQDLFDLGVSVDRIERQSDGLPGVRLRPQGATFEDDDGNVHPVGLRNQHAFRVVATVGDVDATVVLRFRDRDEVLRTVTSSNTVGPSTREFTINHHAFRFRHGPVPFTVYATGPDGQVASDTGTFRFYQDLSLGDLIVMQGEDLAGTDGDPPVRIDPVDGEPCQPLTVRLDVAGMTAGEATPQPVFDADGIETHTEGGLLLSWDGEEPVEMGLLQGSAFGGRFVATVVDDFSLDVGEAQKTVTFTVDAERWFADEDLQAEFGANTVRTVDVTVVEGCL